MKKSEISIIAVIVIISAGIAYFVGQSVLGSVAQRGVSVQTIDKISGDVPQPNQTVFYSGAKNPIVPITIGTAPTQQQPLNGGQ